MNEKNSGFTPRDLEALLKKAKDNFVLRIQIKAILTTLTFREERTACAYYLRGIPVSIIASYEGVCTQTVYNILKKSRKKLMHPIRIKKLLELIDITAVSNG
jgi:hypothetical protein